MSLVLTPLPGIPLIRRGVDLVKVVLGAIDRAGLTMLDGDILVLAQKIVSKSEGRMVDLSTIEPSKYARDLAIQTGKDARLLELILQESNVVLRTRSGVIIVEHRLGFVCANAGIDHSNVASDGSGTEEWVLLLPADPDATAQAFRQRFEAASEARLGVMIIDSHGRAWRQGTVGVAIGLAGMPGLVDLRGQQDLFGYKLRITQVGAADELAAAASLMMGQAAEGTPVIHARGFPYSLREATLGELLRQKEQDLFR